MTLQRKRMTEALDANFVPLSDSDPWVGGDPGDVLTTQGDGTIGWSEAAGGPSPANAGETADCTTGAESDGTSARYARADHVHHFNAAAPGSHAPSHVTGGGDVIANAVAAGNAGLMSGADKTKLDGIAAGAEVNVNADWNAGTGDAQVLNKPTLGDAAAKNVGTGASDVAAGNHAHGGVYDPAGTATSAVSAHDGAASPHSGKFDAAGAASTVAGNLTTHANLTSTAHGGIPAAYTDEMAQDAIGTAIAAGTQSNVTVTYNDSAGSLSFAVTWPKLDDLAVPDDNADLDVSTARHGLFPKLPAAAGKYLKDDLTWGTPSAALPDMVVTKLSVTADTTIAAGFGAYVSDQLEIANGITLEVGNGAILEVG